MSEQKLLTIIWGEGLDMWITKDMCQFPYTLAKYYGWQATFCYFLGDHELANDEYEKFVTLRCLGRAADYHDEAVRAKEYIYISIRMRLTSLCFLLTEETPTR